MNKVIEKIIYPAGFLGDEKAKNAFYQKKKEIAEKAIQTTSKWEAFYLCTEYFLPNGEKWLYFEDTDYGVPSSLERIA